MFGPCRETRLDASNLRDHSESRHSTSKARVAQRPCLSPRVLDIQARAMPKKPPSARSNPYLRNRATVIRLGGPDHAARPSRGEEHHRPPTPNAQPGSMPSSSNDPPRGNLTSMAPESSTRRLDATLVQNYSQGCQETAFEIAGSLPRRLDAQTTLQHLVYSQTSLKPREARLALWNRLSLQAGVPDPFAITPESIKLEHQC